MKKAYQFFGDRQTQPGAAIFACGIYVGLSKTFKYFLLFIGWNANARILNHKLDRSFLACRIYLPCNHNDLAVMRELDRIGQQVTEYLVQPRFIREHFNIQAVIDIGLKAYILGMSLGTELQ